MGSEWKEVVWRKRKYKGNSFAQGGTGGKGRLDIAKSGEKFDSDRISSVSYFFSEFPDDFGAMEMLSVFQKYGRVIEVVIPYKRDKRGKRFGFVRFWGVKDPEFFATKLDNIIIGSRKIFVNIPRFGRSMMNVGSNMVAGQNGSGSKTVESSDQPSTHKERVRQVGTSYANAVKNGRKISDGAQSKGKRYIQRKKPVNIEFSVETDKIQKLGNAYVGRVCIPGTTYCIQDEFLRQGYFAVKVTPLGANLALLETNDVEDMQSLISDGKEWLSQWFVEVRPWSPKEIDNERLT